MNCAIFKGLEKGKSFQEIAEEYGLSAITINRHYIILAEHLTDNPRTRKTLTLILYAEGDHSD